MTETTAISLVTVAVVVLSLGGLTAVRRFVPRERLAQHTEVAGYVYAVVGVIYGVILAQVVVAAWDEYRDARDVSTVEASAVLNLNRLARVWPDAQRTDVEAALAAYARQVIEIEWPAMHAGDFSLASRPAQMDGLWRAYDGVARSPVAASANYAASLDQLDALDEARRGRFLLGESTLPRTMTLTLLLGGIVTVGFSYLFAVENGWVHGLITASLAILIALLLLLEYQLESPFRGVDAIEPTSMQLVLQEMEDGSG
jgi:hypothetical protein